MTDIELLKTLSKMEKSFYSETKTCKTERQLEITIGKFIDNCATLIFDSLCDHSKKVKFIHMVKKICDVAVIKIYGIDDFKEVS